MIENKVYSEADINFTADALAHRVEPNKVLMCTPTYFEVLDIKNIYMQKQLGSVNTADALHQWANLNTIYEQLKTQQYVEDVLVIDGAKGCEDMVFAANQSFPWLNEDGEKVVVMSKMYHSSRAKEVPFFENFYAGLGYQIQHLQHTSFFEGMGDTIPHPSLRLLYGGYGHRSSKEAYTELSQLLNVPIIALELTDERFYHLDTCFLPVSKDIVMICAEAFTQEGLIAIKKLFNKVISIPIEEASQFFALNAHIIPSSDTHEAVAIIQAGAEETATLLSSMGVRVIFTDTSEYMKSGGSVFCMKMMIY